MLRVPYRSQYDASPYQNSNCGPSALAMVLQAYGLSVTNDRLRAIADQLQGTSGYNDGIALDYLVQIAQQAGLRTEGLFGSDRHYEQWSMGDVIREIRRGYPVITLVHYAALPAHASSSSTSDHYIVVVGLTDSGFVINDPASVGNEGYRQLLRPDQLLAAWHAATIQEQAVAFLPPVGGAALGVDGAMGNLLGSAPNAISNVAVADTAPSPTPAAEPTPTTPPMTATPRSTAVLTATAPPTRLPPPPNPTFVAWSVGIGSWQHAGPIGTLQAVPPTPTGAPKALVLAERTSNPNSTMPVLIVIGLIGAAALAILKSPRDDDWTARD